MKCPFVNAVSKGLFQKSNISLSSAINHCPFILQKRASHQPVVADAIYNSAYSSIPKKSVCPYTRGEEAPGSRCPFTGIDVSRIAHSEVLQKIHAETPVNEIPEPVAAPTIPLAWQEPISNLLEAKRKDKTYRKFNVVNKDTERTPIIEKVVPNRAFAMQRESYCSNDYLNMSAHPQVIDAAKHAAELHGTGAGGTRNIAGTSELTTALEVEIRDWHKMEDALLFNGCYKANDETLSTLLGKHFPGAQCFSDAGNHASMIQGMLKGKREQKDPSGKLFKFKHDNPDDLERLLRAEWLKNPHTRRIVAFESVHSMGGNIQRVEELCDVAHRYGALTFCDEVHAIGLYGSTGAGIAETQNIQHKIDIVSGTLGKGVGGFGGYIAASSVIVDMIRQYAPGFIFTTAMPPTVLAPNIASIRILKSSEGQNLREMHWTAVEKLRSELDKYGIPYKKPSLPSHVTAIQLGSADLADSAMRYLDQCGFYAQSIKYPTVPMGEEMLRITVSPRHLRHQDIIPRFAQQLSQTIKAN